MIPLPAIDRMDAVLFEIEAEVTAARLYLREARQKSAAAEATWRARLYRRNRGADAEPGLPGDPRAQE